MSGGQPERSRDDSSAIGKLIMRYFFVMALSAFLLMNSAAFSQLESKPPEVGIPAQSLEKPQANDARRATTGEPTDAERLTRLQRLIESDQQRISEAGEKLKSVAKEFDAANTGFKDLDLRLENEKKELQKLLDAGKQQEADALALTIADTTKKWQLAKERFDLAIEQRKVAQEQLTALAQKLTQDQKALDQLIAPPKSDTSASAGEEAAQSPSNVPAAQLPMTAPKQEAPDASPAAPSNMKSTAESGPLTVPAITLEPSAAIPPSAEVDAANKDLTEKEALARSAERSAEAVTERLKALDNNVALEREAMQGARKLADNAQSTLDALEGDYQKAISDGAPSATVQEIRRQIVQNQSRLRDALAEARKRGDLLDERQSERAALLAEQMSALRKAREERAKADDARRNLNDLTNPFTVKSILQWVFLHGPKILIIILAAAILLWMIRAFGLRAMGWIVHNGNRGSEAEREKRATTLVGVFKNAATLVVYVASILMVLQEAGVPIIPLLGGAAVAGLAVAFGAQNLVKDYFSGFMILLENQYGVNDVVKIAGVSGLVERITLRITVLRDVEGTAHFVPHSSVTTVSNMTHGWSRAVFDVDVAYKEDVDRVMQVLMSLTGEIRKDLNFGHMILADAEMLGVESLGDSAVVIRFMIKTRPLMQWNVKREMNRRIKNKFDELGIEIPFPHRTVYHRYEENGHDQDVVNGEQIESRARSKL
jgi:small-conductance mechanosensitive channel